MLRFSNTDSPTPFTINKGRQTEAVPMTTTNMQGFWESHAEALNVQLGITDLPLTAADVGTEWTSNRGEEFVNAVSKDWQGQRCRITRVDALTGEVYYLYDRGGGEAKRAPADFSNKFTRASIPTVVTSSTVQHPEPARGETVPAPICVGDTWQIAGDQYRVTAVNAAMVNYERRTVKGGTWKPVMDAISIQRWNDWIQDRKPDRVDSITFRTKPTSNQINVAHVVKTTYAGEVKINLGHDYTDPYCVSVSEYGRTPLCKHCGGVEEGYRGRRVCEPYNWRVAADSDSRYAMDYRSKDAAERPKYSAPELRAANMWTCGLGRSQR